MFIYFSLSTARPAQPTPQTQTVYPFTKFTPAHSTLPCTPRTTCPHQLQFHTRSALAQNPKKIEIKSNLVFIKQDLAYLVSLNPLNRFLQVGRLKKIKGNIFKFMGCAQQITNKCHGWKVWSNGNTSVPKSVPRFVWDKVRQDPNLRFTTPM